MVVPIKRIFRITRWFIDGAGSSMALVHRWRWCIDGAGASMAVVHRWRWCIDGGGAGSTLA
jgi:hypothetical protein